MTKSRPIAPTLQVWSSFGFPVVRQHSLSRLGAARAFRLDLPRRRHGQGADLPHRALGCSK